jgi:uncharacterized membrane protein YdjX (TVP38/TMEM64 family)
VDEAPASEPRAPLDYQPKPAPRRRGLGRATPVAFIATALPILGSVTTVAVGPFIAHWLRAQGWLGVVYFTAAFAIAGALTLAPTYTTSVIAGWTFGFQRGFPAIVIGTVGGATLCFLGARWLAMERVAQTFREHPKWDLVRRALLEENPWKTLWIVFLMRLSPILPFGTTNVLLSTAGVRLDLYIIGTLLGLVPRTGLIALAAASAERLDFTTAESWGVLIAGLGATGICIVVMAIIGKHALDRATRQRETV